MILWCVSGEFRSSFVKLSVPAFPWALDDTHIGPKYGNVGLISVTSFPIVAKHEVPVPFHVLTGWRNLRLTAGKNLLLLKCTSDNAALSRYPHGVASLSIHLLFTRKVACTSKKHLKLLVTITIFVFHNNNNNNNLLQSNWQVGI